MFIPLKGKQINFIAEKTAKGVFMKKGKILVLALVGLLMASGMVLTGCDDLGYTPTPSNPSNGCPNYSCHAYTDSDGDGSFDVCNKSSCRVYNVPYPVPPNTNVKCNC
jgi:hypothetical protein